MCTHVGKKVKGRHVYTYCGKILSKDAYGINLKNGRTLPFIMKNKWTYKSNPPGVFSKGCEKCLVHERARLAVRVCADRTASILHIHEDLENTQEIDTLCGEQLQISQLLVDRVSTVHKDANAVHDYMAHRRPESRFCTKCMKHPIMQMMLLEYVEL